MQDTLRVIRNAVVGAIDPLAHEPFAPTSYRAGSTDDRDRPEGTTRPDHSHGAPRWLDERFSPFQHRFFELGLDQEEFGQVGARRLKVFPTIALGPAPASASRSSTF